MFCSSFFTSSKQTKLFAIRWAVVVYPVHFGPSIKTPPMLFHSSSITLSAILGRYLFIFKPNKQPNLFYFASQFVLDTTVSLYSIASFGKGKSRFERAPRVFNGHSPEVKIPAESYLGSGKKILEFLLQLVVLLFLLLGFSGSAI